MMNQTGRWPGLSEAGALGRHRRLTAAGVPSRMYLAYAGEGWVVTAPAVTAPFTGCGAVGCGPARPCPPCAAVISESRTSEATLAWCAERSHPWSTYNASLDRTYCRCGARQEDGEHEIDMGALWEMRHDHPPGARCTCYVRAQQAS